VASRIIGWLKLAQRPKALRYFEWWGNNLDEHALRAFTSISFDA
jgi:hypothetical protein